MNTRPFREIILVLFMAVVLATSACGTLQIDTEPVVTEDQAVGSAVEESPEVVDEDTTTPVEISTGEDAVEEAGEPLNKASEIIVLDEIWKQFTDYRLGFSIKFPKEMATTRGSCTWKEDEGSYRPETALVPVQIFEGDDTVYIGAEHYYELTGERQEDGRAYFDECNIVTNSLELLRDPDAFKEPYWELVVLDVHNDSELDSFIKERYGPGCSAGDQLPSAQDGVYDITIQGDGKSLEETQCPINYMTVVKYFPEGNKVVAWDRGQANYFPADVTYQVVYDQEMEDSFRFLTESSSDAVESSQGGLVTELSTYANDEYGFALNYPASWTVAEVNDIDFVGPGSRSVQLSQGTITLVIGYRRAGEQAPIGGSGTSAGEFEIRGTVQVAGQEVERSVIVYEGKDKAVMYDQSGVQSDGQPGAPIATGGLEFAPRMNDFAQIDYGQIELSKAVQEDADMIVSSLTIIEAEGDADKTTSAANYDYTGWQSYANETLGYSLMYPGQADVMGADRDKSVEFVGPIVGDDHWPWFSIQHFDSEFFRPPVGTDVRQWLADSYIPYAPLDEEMTIGGLPAVHYAVEATPQAYGRDEYYVIDGDHLFQITLLHAGGNEDWSLYEQFLDSITFTERG